MTIIEKIIQDCEEIIELCNQDLEDMLGRKYKFNPHIEDFNN
jgi:hypothetical protein